MTRDTIEREILIQAGIDHVWSLISRPGFWVGDDLRFDMRAGEGETVVIDAGRHGCFPVRVIRLEPPRYAAYRWASAFPGEEPVDGNATTVEFTLVERGSGVLVRMKESGFASLQGTDAFRSARVADNTSGWTAQLDRLRDVALGAPA